MEEEANGAVDEEPVMCGRRWMKMPVKVWIKRPVMVWMKSQ